MNELTPDGLIFLCGVAIAILSVFLYIFVRSRTNDGIVELPWFLMFGWGGAAWSPNIIVISKDARNKKALIAHERRHQEQQREHGLLNFWFKYITNKKFRLDMEVDAYRVWLQTSPEDYWQVAQMLKGYGVDLTDAKIRELLLG